MNKEEFVKEVENLDIKINEKILKNLDEYFNLLNEWNKKFNLTRIVEEKEVYLKHFYDSLTIQKSVNMYEFSSLIDVGTGAGFPGMVLAIFFSNLKVTLLEANTKKCLFLQKVKEKLNLDNVEIINERSEKYAKTNREKYDIATCRAVSHLTVISEIIIPMIKVSGYFLPLKGEIDVEINESLKKIEELNSIILNVIRYNLPIENSKRSILVIQKKDKTDIKYPREYNKIIKDLKIRQK